MNINATLLGQFITFAILVWFTMKYIWPPITKAILEREKKIADGLEAAERSRRDLEMTEHKITAMIRDAKLEASHIVEQANKRFTQIVEESKEQARQEAQRVFALAQEEIAREASKTKEALKKQFAILAVAGAEKIIRQKMDSSIQASLLNTLFDDLAAGA